jgi:hypothetical protein
LTGKLCETDINEYLKLVSKSYLLYLLSHTYSWQWKRNKMFDFFWMIKKTTQLSILSEEILWHTRKHVRMFTLCIDKSHFIATIINIINVRSKLVYIKHLFVLDTGEGSQGLTRTSCPACTQVVDRECPLDRRFLL